MAKTGQPGGRTNLENNRVRGPIHNAPSSVETSPQSDQIRNASVRSGAPNTNRDRMPDRVPETQKDFPESGAAEYTKPGRTTPNTNRNV